MAATEDLLSREGIGSLGILCRSTFVINILFAYCDHKRSRAYVLRSKRCIDDFILSFMWARRWLREQVGRWAYGEWNIHAGYKKNEGNVSKNVVAVLYALRVYWLLFSLNYNKPYHVHLQAHSVKHIQSKPRSTLTSHNLLIIVCVMICWSNLRSLWL